MTRKDLARIVGNEVGITITEAEHVVNVVLQTIKGLLVQKKSITLKNFGTFEVKHVSKRIGRNLAENKPIVIPEQDKVVFVPSKDLKEAVK